MPESPPKKMLRITLVAIHPHRSPQAVPLALAFLKGFLLADERLSGEIEIDILEFYLTDSPNDCAEAILKGAPDLVAFSVYVWSREYSLTIAAKLKAAAPTLTLCAGGAEPTANPTGLLAFGLFDFLIRGEGEAPFAAATRLAILGRPPVGVPGVLLPGELPGALPEPIELERVPSPYLNHLLDPTIPGGALWQLSRGCDFACAFCFDHKGEGGVRRFKMERVEEELRLFANLSVPQVFVLDSTFNKDQKRAKEILRMIGRLAPQVHFHFEVRSEFIDAEMAELFASITCSLQIGLQSSDSGVLRLVGRSFDADDFTFRVGLLNQSGAIFGFDLIYGLPGDSLQLFCASLDFALRLYPNHLDIFPLAVLPGTRLYGKAAQLGLKHLEAPPYTVLTTPEFPPPALEKARLMALACDIFYSRGKAVAWFNAVTWALKLTPSALLNSFSLFLGGRRREEEIEEREIWPLQRQFLEEIFRERKKARLLPLALDLVDYHHHYALAILAAPPVPRSLKKIDLLARPLRLAPSATNARFSYQILEILEGGDLVLADFASSFRQSPSFAVIYPARGEVCTESLSELYFRLLQALDGRNTAKDLCLALALPTSEALPFLKFAASEGIVLFD